MGSILHSQDLVPPRQLTLALPKTGLKSDEARRHVGDLYLADISVPPELYSRPSLGIDAGPIFHEA